MSAPYGSFAEVRAWPQTRKPTHPQRRAVTIRMIAGTALLTLAACETAPLDPHEAPQLDVVGGTTSATITLNPKLRYQTIHGWEAHAQAGHEAPDFPLFKNTLLDMATNDLGINRLRLEIKSGMENSSDYYTMWRRGQISDSTWRCVRFATVNDNNDPRVINPNGFKFSALDSMVVNVVLPMKQRLAARGEKLWVNLLYVAFNKQICSGQYHHDDSREEYAEFILAASLHLRSRYGIVPDSWEVILEPENTSFWRGARIGSAVVATAARLSANGFTPRFVVPSTARSYNAVPYFDAMIAAWPGVKPYLLELSYHRYSSVTKAELSTIAARAATYNIESSMLEHIGSGHEDLHMDLKQANVSAWQQFALAFGAGDGGGQYFGIDRTVPSSPRITIGSRTKFLRQYFRFIRAGAVRIEATSNNVIVNPVAFINTNGKYVVVAKTNGAAQFGVHGLPAGTYGITFTTSSAYDVNRPDVTITAGQVVNAAIPDKGVLTIYRR